jgi:hypothetical protein
MNHGPWSFDTPVPSPTVLIFRYWLNIRNGEYHMRIFWFGWKEKSSIHSKTSTTSYVQKYLALLASEVRSSTALSYYDQASYPLDILIPMSHAWCKWCSSLQQEISQPFRREHDYHEKFYSKGFHNSFTRVNNPHSHWKYVKKAWFFVARCLQVE